MVAANKDYFSLQSIFINKFISSKTKIRIYKVLIKPVLVYGSETWAFTKKTLEANDL